jgi:hypothetical protein
MSSGWLLSTEKCENKIPKLLTFNSIRTPDCEQYAEQQKGTFSVKNVNNLRYYPARPGPVFFCYCVGKMIGILHGHGVRNTCRRTEPPYGAGQGNGRFSGPAIDQDRF